jgi:hypothetical protein
MSEFVTSLLVVFSEVALVLAIVIGLIVFFFVKRGRRDKVLAKTLVETVKEREPQRIERLKDILEKVHHLDEVTAQQNVDEILASEKHLYSRIIKVFLGHDREGLVKINKDVESLAETYRKLSTVAEAGEVEKYHSDDNPLVQAQLRAQIKKLEKENEKLEKDLNEAMESMDSMLKEYTLMYSGGGAKREGVKHLENELSQLKQKIAKSHIEAMDGDDDDTELAPGGEATDEVPDLSMDELEPDKDKK